MVVYKCMIVFVNTYECMGAYVFIDIYIFMMYNHV